MKRLQLRVSDLTKARILSRPEIKNIMGGSGGSGGSTGCWLSCVEMDGTVLIDDMEVTQCPTQDGFLLICNSRTLDWSRSTCGGGSWC